MELLAGGFDISLDGETGFGFWIEWRSDRGASSTIAKEYEQKNSQMYN